MQINYTIELSKDPTFDKIVNKLISTYKIDEIIETGTYKGDGSTQAFARTGLSVVTIECNPQFCEEARRNLSGFNNVQVINGHTLKIEDIKEFLRNDKENPPTEIMVDHKANPDQHYFQEINKKVQIDNALPPLIRNEIRQLIFLDSSGGMGLMEFLEVFNLPELFRNKKILVMDDVSHVKHYRSAKMLINQGFEFNYSETKRWGWTSFKMQTIV